MEDGYGPTLITLTDEDGEEFVLEYISSLELNGCEYRAFFPVQEDESAEPNGDVIILKVIQENGEELLSTCDSDEEADAAFDAFMESLYDDES